MRYTFLIARAAWVAAALMTLRPVTVAAQSCSDAPICSSSNAVFCSGFEEGSKAIWDDYDGNPDSTNLIMADGGPCNQSGNHIMRLVKVLPSSHDKMYARWYQKWEPGYDFTARNHGSGLNAGDRTYLGRSGNRPTGADWFSSWMEPSAEAGAAHTGRPSMYTYYRGMYQDCSNPNGSCWGDHIPCLSDEGSGYCTNPAHRENTLPPQFVTGRWYCIEIMLDGGTPTTSASGANGTINYWIDNVQYGPWGNLWLRTTSSLKVSTLYLNLYHHEAHSVPGVMLDDVVVATSRIGCHGNGAPAPPTNLRILP
jgi:hypothetical protein